MAWRWCLLIAINCWKMKIFRTFQASFHGIIFFKELLFLTRFPIQNFSPQLSRYHIFTHFRFWKIIFHANFPATIFSPDAYFFHPFSNLEFCASKFRLQFFNSFSFVHFVFTYFSNRIFHQGRRIRVKLGIHLRQRQPEEWRSSFSSASVDGATNRATCLRGCHDPSHWLSVDQSEASPRNSPPRAQYG